ncbi:MAG: condensation domain-containing protein [Polyangiaceae bacterium]
MAGRLDPARLTTAVAATIARQEALRTSFHRSETGGLRARVGARVTPQVLVSEIDPHEPDDDRAQLLAVLRRSPLDLSGPPLMRCAVVRRSSTDFLCGFLLHHAIADAWSMSVLTRDVGEAYGRLEAGGTPDLAPAPRFSDFAASERAAAESGAFSEKERFWRERLAGLPAHISIPRASATRPDVFTYTADAVRFELDAKWLSRIRRLCAEQGVTLYMVVLTSLFLLLHRHGGEEDLYLRSPAANRVGTALAGVMGPFGSSMILRQRVLRGTGALDLLQSVKQNVLSAQENIGLPAPLLGRCVPVAGAPSYGSRSQVVYNHHNYPRHPAAWGSLQVTELREALARIKADLVLHTWVRGETLRCALAFYTGILTRSDVEILAAEWRSIVSELARERDA